MAEMGFQATLIHGTLAAPKDHGSLADPGGFSLVFMDDDFRHFMHTAFFRWRWLGPDSQALQLGVVGFGEVEEERYEGE